jgi:phosphatidylcholine synthase
MPAASDSMDVTADHSSADRYAKPAECGTKAGRSASAFAVHVLTACGAALCLMALLAAISANWARMFGWLGFALIIDAVDGTLARRFRVKEVLPRWSGDTLDLVVDYLGYVFVPAYAILAGRLLPNVAAIPAGLLILITSALYFADRRMKTSDNYFRGFPALWNVAAFYLFLLRPAPWFALVVVVTLCILSFVPFPFLHPLRVKRLRGLNIALLLAWSVLAVVTLIEGMEPGTSVTLALVALALYFFAAGVFRAPAAPAS